MPPRHSKAKNPPKKPKETSSSSSSSLLVDIQLQQTLLTTFTAAFSSRFNEDLQSTIQRVKGHLYARDFEEAFADEERLEAYAVKWSPSRALAYLDLFCSIPQLHDGLLHGRGERGDEGERKRILCLGGGAGAEIVALAGWFRSLHDGRLNVQKEEDGKGEAEGGRIEVLAVDIAPWTVPLRKLQTSLVTPPPLSNYASADIKASNRPVVYPDDLNVEFLQRDVLNLGGDELAATCKGTGIVTLMFTLNELYSASVTKTMRMLLDLTGTVGRGLMLLVVDSPGSYSVVELKKGEVDGKRRKKYPMQWLLDHTLLEAAKGEGHGEQKWEKVREEESRWFRLGEGLEYPIGLEDMRMQVHIYRRL
ncbi:MAG: hypothetical protein L6R39_004656 [Caloplaca ligustica]|nr:MAG: hypothetical protein L6R39_004656 [Caloplaca ligustica]